MSVEIDISIDRVNELMQSRTICDIFIDEPDFNYVRFTLIQVVWGYMYSMLREFNGRFANYRPVDTEFSDFFALKIDKNVLGLAYLALDLDFSGIVKFSKSQKELVSYVAEWETSPNCLILMQG